MKERPILFKTEMVKAILEGRKTQTRRIVKPQPLCIHQRIAWNILTEEWCLYDEAQKEVLEKFECPYGKIGDHLYVKETWYKTKHVLPSIICYKADYNDPENYKWKPSLFMPKKYARIWLEVTEIKVQQLHQISFDDILAEGCIERYEIKKCYASFTGQNFIRNKWIKLWDSINVKKGYGWGKNPYVWVIEFKRSN